MSTNVGAIDLALVLNSNAFNKQLNNVNKTATKAGNLISGSLGKIATAAIAAFSITKIVQFSKECINLASDLEEVQNVVDTAFPTMNSQVNSFAKNAITTFGLSEVKAKKYISTFGAMSQSFGYTEKEAYKMSEALTSLTGDVSSFYNTTSDEVYTKLKSVFTGETETLKELGVVMTQNALDQYALANGYKKTTAKMSEQEKVALRLAFVQNKLKIASGDFVRTSDSWANQTRVLSLRFDELKATLGSGFINVLTPVVKVINQLLAKLQVLANSFKSFTDMITGNVNSGGLGSLASDATDASKSVDGIGDSAKNAKKSLLGLRSFDALNNLTTSDGDDTSSGGSSGVDTSGLTNFAADASASIANTFASAFDPFVNAWNTNGKSVIDGATHAFNGLKNLFETVGGSFEKIWTNGTAEKILSKILSITGKIFKSVGNIGDTWAKAWKNNGNGDKIIQNIADAFGNLLDIVDEASSVIEEFTQSEEFQNFADAMVSSLETVSGWAEKLTDTFKNLWENGGKDTFQNLLEFGGKLGELINVLAKILDPFIQSTLKTLEPVLQGIIKGFDGFIGTLSGFADYLIGVFTGDWERAWKGIKEYYSGVWKMIEGILDVATLGMYSKAKDWLSNIGNSIKEGFNSVKNTVNNIWTGITTNTSNAMTNAKNTISNILSSIKTTWNNVWESLKNGVKDAFDGMWNGIKTTANSILSGIEKMVNGVIKGINRAIDGLNKMPGTYISRMGTVSLPRLAQGGYFKANQPTLAMVGDNRTQDEIVSPVPKMQDALRSVLKEQKTSGSGNSEIIVLLKQILELLKSFGGDTVLEVGEIELARAVIRGMKLLQAKSDKPILDFI